MIPRFRDRGGRWEERCRPPEHGSGKRAKSTGDFGLRVNQSGPPVCHAPLLALGYESLPQEAVQPFFLLTYVCSPIHLGQP